jgi:hypothetical protein
LLLEVDFMKSRFIIPALICAAIFGLSLTAFGQKPGGQTELSTNQRLDVMSSKLDLMRRSLNSAIAAMPAEDKSKDKKTTADDPVVRLKGLEKEVSSLSSEVSNLKNKNDKAEKFDPADVDRLESRTVCNRPRARALIPLRPPRLPTRRKRKATSSV